MNLVAYTRGVHCSVGEEKVQWKMFQGAQHFDNGDGMTNIE